MTRSRADDPAPTHARAATDVTALHEARRRRRAPLLEAVDVLVLNGPNLDLLGLRQPEIYGHETLDDLEAACAARAAERGLTLACRQSAIEGELIDRLHEARWLARGVVFNPGGYTHVSVALHDAARAIERPVIEVHLSNIHAREPFRHRSMLSPAAAGVICGLGPLGYQLAIDALAATLAPRGPQ